MAGIKVAVVADTLESKLGAHRSEGRKHVKFHIYDDDDLLVARTELSRGVSEIDDNFLSMQARQLHVPRRFWIELCRCDHDRDAYLARVT